MQHPIIKILENSERFFSPPNLFIIMVDDSGAGAAATSGRAIELARCIPARSPSWSPPDMSPPTLRTTPPATPERAFLNRLRRILDETDQWTPSPPDRRSRSRTPPTQQQRQPPQADPNTANGRDVVMTPEAHRGVRGRSRSRTPPPVNKPASASRQLSRSGGTCG